MDGLQIALLEPDDRAGVEAMTALREVNRQAEEPFLHSQTVDMVEAAMRWGHDQSPEEHYLAHLDGELVATGFVHWSTWDNPELAWMGIEVHPAHRRAGIGTAVLRHLEARCRELGRTNVGLDAWDGSGGIGFLEHHGYEKRSQAILRRQDLEALALGQVEGLHERAREKAGDYDLLRFDGPLPEDLIEDYGRMAASINDAPLDDLDMEDDDYSPARLRKVEEAQQGRNRDHLRLAARHRRTGELGGHTELVVERWDPTVAYQLDTAVAPAHRGHRLGLLLKSAMVLWLRERHPEVRTVDTWNAESNRWMIEVNEQLGYRVVARELQFQRRLPEGSPPVH